MYYKSTQYLTCVPLSFLSETVKSINLLRETLLFSNLWWLVVKLALAAVSWVVKWTLRANPNVGYKLTRGQSQQGICDLPIATMSAKGSVKTNDETISLSLLTPSRQL